MTDIDFEKHQTAFRQMIAEKSLAEVRAMRSTFEKLNEMSYSQRNLLIADLELMEQYKTRSHSSTDEFQKIMQGFYRAF